MVRRLKNIAIVVAAIVALWVTNAGAHHAVLVGAEPPPGARLTEAPLEARARFNTRLVLSGSGLSVVDVAGRRYNAGPARLEAADPRTLIVPVSPLPTGAYEVRWSVSVEVDPEQSVGAYAFEIVENPAARLSNMLRREVALTAAFGILALGVARSAQ